MKKLPIYLLCLLFTIASCTPKTAEELEEKFEIKRGVNLSHWLSQSEVRGEERAKHIDEEDVKRLKEFGFDHVRIPIDEVQFWDEDGNKLQEAWDLLTKTLDNLQKHQMRAIVDLHIIRSHYFNAVNEEGTNSLFEDDKALEQFINLWAQLSEVLKKYPNSMVAYEFLNEPVADNPEQWNALIVKVHKDLRTLEPERVLVIGSNRWQGVGTFKDLKVPENDPNIILSFHYYEPFVMTHYNAHWTPMGEYNGKVDYPGAMISQEDFNKQTDKVKQQVEQYTKEWNKDTLNAQIQQAVVVAKKYNLPLICGEWGYYEKSPKEPSLRWMKDMIAVFDENNLAWDLWCYDGDFGFWNPDDSGFKDKEMLDAIMSGKKLGE
ncbi:MAG: cellulase family glycosylhydrolase [Bacteroidaceae bacterium]|nr:cellulase family glycosylhydrolase [Bacteroidaceae bacterium]